MKIINGVMKVARRLKREGYGRAYRRLYLKNYMEAKIEIAKNLLMENLEVEIISKCTELPIEKLRSLSQN